MRDERNRKRKNARNLRARAGAACLGLALGLSVSLPGAGALTPGKAEAAKPYTYTVHFYAGQQGTFSGKESLTFTGLEYGDRISFSQRSVQLPEDSKYYIRGIRESGNDNSTVQESSFVVTGDQDYVVAYGVRGAAVAYTINYQDEAGNELAPSETYYGNVGDKPVIAYLYIDGYQPESYNLTKTLDENAAENVFTFVYRSLTGEVPEPTQTPEPEGQEPEQQPAQQPAAGTQTPAAGGTAAPGAGGVTVTPAATTPAAAPGTTPGGDVPGTTPGGDVTTIPDEDTPAGLTDLDDEQTPLANQLLDNISNAEVLGVPAPAVLMSGMIVGLGIGFGLWRLWMRRRKTGDE